MMIIRSISQLVQKKKQLISRLLLARRKKFKKERYRKQKNKQEPELKKDHTQRNSFDMLVNDGC